MDATMSLFRMIYIIRIPPFTINVVAYRPLFYFRYSPSGYIYILIGSFIT